MDLGELGDAAADAAKAAGDMVSQQAVKDTLKQIVEAEAWVIANGLPKEARDLHHLKSLGFSDKQLAKLAGLDELAVRAARHTLRVTPVFFSAHWSANRSGGSAPFRSATALTAADATSSACCVGSPPVLPCSATTFPAASATRAP